MEEGNVCKDEIDQVHQYQKVYRKKQPKYESKKEDVYNYIRKTKRVINMVKI